MQQASFILLTFLLIPLLIYILYSQGGSINRLEKYGIKAHPKIQHVIGNGNGYGENPTWIFQLGSNEGNVLAFYKQLLFSSQWKLTEDTELYLRYTQEEKILTIAHRKSPSKDTLNYYD